MLKKRVEIRKYKQNYCNNKKRKINETKRNNKVKTYAKKSVRGTECHEKIKLFCKLFREGLTFVCVVCNRYFYQKVAKKFD